MQNPNLQKILHSLLMPALAGAAGTGAASAYLSQKSHDPAESKGERRRRILRNAMYGTALGGMAGASLPAGAKMVGDTFFGKPDPNSLGPLTRGADKAWGFGLRHVAPVATAGIGGWSVYHTDLARKLNAGRSMAQSLASEPTREGGSATINNLAGLRSVLGREGGAKYIMGRLAHKFSQDGQPHPESGHFRANEDLIATGESPGLRLKEMESLFGGSRSKVLESYKNHLASRGPFSKLVSHLSTDQFPAFQGLRKSKAIQALAKAIPGVENMAGKIEGINPSPIAEAYGRYFRPSVPSTIETIPTVGKLGLLGGGALLANYLQQKAMGN